MCCRAQNYRTNTNPHTENHWQTSTVTIAIAVRCPICDYVVVALANLSMCAIQKCKWFSNLIEHSICIEKYITTTTTTAIKVAAINFVSMNAFIIALVTYIHAYIHLYECIWEIHYELLAQPHIYLRINVAHRHTMRSYIDRHIHMYI